MSHTKIVRRKALSQNFLTPEGARKFASAVRSLDDALVYEIGTGSGAVTEHLSKAARWVHSYEIDRHWVQVARNKLSAHTNTQVHCKNFLRVPAPERPFIVVGNVPFSITTDVLRWVLRARSLDSATLLVQEQVAKKRCGDYGRWSKLTIKSWPTHKWELGSKFSPRLFVPQPSVCAQVMYVYRRKSRLLSDVELSRFYSLVEIGFKGRGGSLLNSIRLAGLVRGREISSIASEIGISPDMPVGLVSPRQWLHLTTYLCSM